MRILLLTVSLLPIAVPASAQETQPLAWSEHRLLAARLSDGLVLTQLALDTLHSVKAEDKKHAFLMQGCRVALTIGVTSLVKAAVERERPDGSNRHSFWSGHTANAVQGTGWRVQVSVPIAIGTGYFRMAANKHYLTDVLAGAGMGLLAQRVCR